MSSVMGGVGTRGNVLVVDDEVQLARAYARWLTAAGYAVETAHDGRSAAELLTRSTFDAILSDIAMPGMTGVELLRTVRQRDLDVPVVLMTARPALESAVEAVELGALRYLVKPIDNEILESVTEHAVRLHRLAKLKREALRLSGASTQPGDRAGLEEAFDRALAGLWLAFQPIVSLSERRVFAFEALMRSRATALPHPGAILLAAERLDRLPDLGRAIRALAALAAKNLPEGSLLFLNLHPADLQDPALYERDQPLTAYADRVVLEVTERAALDEVHNLRERAAQLRQLGYRLAVDDLGAGYAGLATFASLDPEVVKIDMSLIRDIQISRTKRSLVASLVGVCRDLGMKVIAEGVETSTERDVLTELGCELLQGYLFARPAAEFPPVAFP
jgi:EAL domain-containing protein (putative c-di-GMP-specific phosphodiesterase class I)/ActR/RegA family two-component response regulator